MLVGCRQSWQSRELAELNYAQQLWCCRHFGKVCVQAQPIRVFAPLQTKKIIPSLVPATPALLPTPGLLSGFNSWLTPSVTKAVESIGAQLEFPQHEPFPCILFCECVSSTRMLPRSMELLKI